MRSGPRRVDEGSQIRSSVGTAPSEDELARAEAAAGVEASVSETVGRGSRTGYRWRATRGSWPPAPGPQPRARARADARAEPVRPSTSSVRRMPYRWFVGHELRPRRIGPRRSP
jgi:hypothetical protein